MLFTRLCSVLHVVFQTPQMLPSNYQAKFAGIFEVHDYVVGYGFYNCQFVFVSVDCSPHPWHFFDFSYSSWNIKVIRLTLYWGLHSIGLELIILSANCLLIPVVLWRGQSLIANSCARSQTI